MNQTEQETALNVAAGYYELRTRKRLRPEQWDKLRAALGSGLTARQVMDAVDLAVSRHGLIGAEKDYWRTVLDDCRNTYRLFVRDGLIEKKEKGKAAP